MEEYEHHWKAFKNVLGSFAQPIRMTVFGPLDQTEGESSGHVEQCLSLLYSSESQITNHEKIRQGRVPSSTFRRLACVERDTLPACFQDQPLQEGIDAPCWPSISLRDYVFLNMVSQVKFGHLPSRNLHNQHDLEKLRVSQAVDTHDINDCKQHQLQPSDSSPHISELTLRTLSHAFKENLSNSERFRAFETLLSNITIRELQYFCGIQFTKGTYPQIPPHLSLLCASFRERHSPDGKSILTVGARALLKHCHRDTVEQFWGCPMGSEAEKNKAAELVLFKLLKDCAWINVHSLPHDVKVVELRSSLGYGARWSSDGKMFRGFLEPQTDDGHERGWKHQY